MNSSSFLKTRVSASVFVKGSLGVNRNGFNFSLDTKFCVPSHEFATVICKCLASCPACHNI